MQKKIAIGAKLRPGGGFKVGEFWLGYTKFGYTIFHRRQRAVRALPHYSGCSLNSIGNDSQRRNFAPISKIFVAWYLLRLQSTYLLPV